MSWHAVKTYLSINQSISTCKVLWYFKSVRTSDRSRYRACKETNNKVDSFGECASKWNYVRFQSFVLSHLQQNNVCCHASIPLLDLLVKKTSFFFLSMCHLNEVTNSPLRFLPVDAFLFWCVYCFPSSIKCFSNLSVYKFYALRERSFFFSSKSPFSPNNLDTCLQIREYFP